MGNVYIGTMGWSYSFWVGSFYPENTDSSRFLFEYSRSLNTVEIDNTFYRTPNRDTVTHWREETPYGFLFSAKFPRIVTHQKMLKNCEKEVERFLANISLLGDRLGPLLMQLPPSFGREHLQYLRDFLTGLPEGFQFAVEVRNKTILNESLYSLLREKNTALAMVEGSSIPTVDIKTADFAYIRWEGDRRKVKGILGRIERDRTEEIKRWAEKIRNLIQTQVPVFGYFSKYYSGYPPTDARQLVSMLEVAA
jgi:uncharacterized protein YecE (DUF72 family)